MTNLTATAQSIKKIAPFLFIGLIIAILVVAIIYRFTRKPEVPSPPTSPPSISQDPSQKQPQSIDFSQTERIETPDRLASYQAHKYNNGDSEATNIASVFGFEAGPSSINEGGSGGKLYSFTSQKSSMTISQYRLLYNRTPVESNANLSLSELEEISRKFIESTPLVEKNLPLNQQKIKFLTKATTGKLVSASSFENAYAAEFSFDKNLSSLPIFTNSPDTTYTTVRITKSGEIIYFSSRFFEKFTEIGLYKIKSQQEAVEEIKAGQGKVVQTQILDENGQALELFRNQPENIELATITKLNLAYFLPDDLTEPIQPIFAAEGTFKKGSENGKVVIYLPAIKQGK